MVLILKVNFFFWVFVILWVRIHNVNRWFTIICFHRLLRFILFYWFRSITTWIAWVWALATWLVDYCVRAFFLVISSTCYSLWNSRMWPFTEWSLLSCVWLRLFCFSRSSFFYDWIYWSFIQFGCTKLLISCSKLNIGSFIRWLVDQLINFNFDQIIYRRYNFIIYVFLDASATFDDI